MESRELTNAELEAVAAGKGYALVQGLVQNRPLLARQSWNRRQEVKTRWLFTAVPAGASGSSGCAGGVCQS